MPTFLSTIRSLGWLALPLMVFAYPASGNSSDIKQGDSHLIAQNYAQKFQNTFKAASSRTCPPASDALAHYHLGISLKRLNKEREALNEFWISYLLDPNSPCAKLCLQALAPASFQIDVPLETDEYTEFQIGTRAGCLIAAKMLMGFDRKIAGECNASINVLLDRGTRAFSQIGGFQIFMQPNLSVEKQRYDAEYRRLSNPKEKKLASRGFFVKSLESLRSEYLQDTARITKEFQPFIQNQSTAEQLKHIYAIHEKHWLSDQQAYNNWLSNKEQFNFAKLTQSSAAIITLSSIKSGQKIMPAAHIVVYPCKSGSIQLSHKKAAKNRKQLERTLSKDETFLGPNHLVVAGDLLDLASSYVDARRLPEVLTLSRRAMAICEKGIAEHKPAAFSLLRKMAIVCQKLGDYSQAEQYLKRALQLSQAVFGESSTKLLPILHDLVGIYTNQNRMPDAESISRREISIEKSSGGVSGLLDLVQCYNLEGRFSESEAMLKSALSQQKKAKGDNQNENNPGILSALADVYLAQDRIAEAELVSQRALTILEEDTSSSNEAAKDGLSGNMVQLAAIYIRQSRFDEAEYLCNRAKVIAERRFGIRDLTIAVALEKLAEIYGKQKRFADAEVFLKRSLSIKEQLGGVTAELAVAETLGHSAKLYNCQGRYKESESLLKRALATEEKILGMQPRVIDRIRQLACTYEGEGRYGEAEALLQKSAQQRGQGNLGKQLMRRSSLEQNFLERLAIQQINALKDLNRQKQTISIDEIQHSSSLTSSDTPLKCQALIYEAPKLIQLGCPPVNLGRRLFRSWKKFAPQLSQSCGKEPSSKPPDDDVRKYIEHFGGQELACQAAFRTCLALSCLLLDTAEAFEESGGSASDSLEDSIQGTGNMNALQLASAAEELSLLAGGSADEKLDRLLTLADFYRLDGEYARARNCINRALASTSPTDQAILRANVKLSELLIEQADGSSACSVAEDLLQNSAALLTQDLKAKQRLLRAIALGAQMQQDFEKAVKYASENLSLTQQAFGPGSKEFLEAQTISSAACTALYTQDSKRTATKSQRAGALKDQLRNLSTAIDAIKAKGGNYTSEPGYAILIGNALEALGEGQLALLPTQQLLNKQESLDEIRLCFAQAFDFHRPNPARNGIAALVRDCNGMALCDALSGNMDSARGLSFESAYYLSNYIKTVYPSLSFAEQVAFLQTVKEEINVLLAICNDGYSISRTYENLMRWRGLLVESMRRQTSIAAAAAKTPEQKRLLEQLQTVKSKLVSCLSDETTTDNQLKELSLKKEMLERDVLTASAQNGEHEDIMPSMTTVKFSSILSDAECFLDLYRYRTINTDEHYAVILVMKQNRPVFIDIPNAELIDTAITDWRELCIRKSLRNPETIITKELNQYENVGQSELTDANERLHGAWSVLQNRLFEPIRDALQKMPGKPNKLIICDDSTLSRIPWGMLSVESFAAAGSNQESPTPTFPGFSICHVNSPREFVRLHNGGVESNLKKLLLAGGVKYRNSNTPVLKGSEAELEDLALLARERGLESITLSGLAPTPSSIKQQLEQCSIAHLATHGFFINAADLSASDKAGRIWTLVSVRNPLIDSGLVLAPESGASNPVEKARQDQAISSKSSDGSSRSFHDLLREGGAAGESLLTADEIVGLDLNKCELVTLSACETGLGVQENGQGILGLRSAFMAAGVRSVVVSLWPVSDQATRYFMQKFYSYLWNNKSKTEALQLAQADVKNYKEKNWQHPKYWAAWIVVGRGW